MEVHAPHQPMNTWKDFWIHLGTITAGLLIAVALEQSVEMLHHLHQRHQLEEDLRAEAAKNILILDRNYRNLDTWMAWASTMRDTVNAMHASGGKTKLPYPPKPDLGQTVQTMPSSTAWTTAQASALVDLLPREEAKMYDRVYYELKLYGDTQTTRSDQIREETFFLARFGPVTLAPLKPDLSLMSVDQLDQLSALLTNDLITTRGLRGRMDDQCAAEKAVVDGGKTEDDVLSELNAFVAASEKSPAHDCSSQ